MVLSEKENEKMIKAFMMVIYNIGIYLYKANPALRYLTVYGGPASPMRKVCTIVVSEEVNKAQIPLQGCCWSMSWKKQSIVVRCFACGKYIINKILMNTGVQALLQP